MYSTGPSGATLLQGNAAYSQNLHFVFVFFVTLSDVTGVPHPEPYFECVRKKTKTKKEPWQDQIYVNRRFRCCDQHPSELNANSWSGFRPDGFTTSEEFKKHQARYRVVWILTSIRAKRATYRPIKTLLPFFFLSFAFILQ